jgi:hypothetical protein
MADDKDGSDGIKRLKKAEQEAQEVINKAREGTKIFMTFPITHFPENFLV